MSLTDIIAVYAALMATAAVGWEVYQWWSRGPRLKVKVTANITTLYGTLLRITVENRGTDATTITSVSLLAYDSERAFKKRNFSWKMHVPLSDERQVVVGGDWSVDCHQSQEVEERAKALLYAAVHHSFSDKPILARVRTSLIVESWDDGPR